MSYQGRGPGLRGPQTHRCLCVPFVLLLAVAACDGTSGEDAAEAPPYLSFEDVFRLEKRIVLEEPDSALITGIRALAEGPDGRLVVVDRLRDEFRVYSPRGSLIHRGGGFGQGPGEIDGPLALARDSAGGLLVSDAGNNRVSRYSRSFRYDTAWQPRKGFAVNELAALRDSLLAATVIRGPPVEHTGFLYDYRGRIVAPFHEVATAVDTAPYWRSAVGPVLAASDSYLVAGNTVQYPLSVYDSRADPMDSVGRPSSRWTSIPPTERGQFLPPRQMQKFEKWKRTFTTFGEVAIVRDTILIVVEKDLDPDVLDYEKAAYRVGVYRLTEPRAKVAEGLDVPGAVFGTGDRLYVLLASPPEGPWTLGAYRFAPADRD